MVLGFGELRRLLFDLSGCEDGPAATMALLDDLVLEGIVVLEDGKGGKIKEKTDNNGEFIFRKLTPGKYQVSSSDFNVQSDKESIEVTAGNELTRLLGGPASIVFTNTFVMTGSLTAKTIPACASIRVRSSMNPASSMARKTMAVRAIDASASASGL